MECNRRIQTMERVPTSMANQSPEEDSLIQNSNPMAPAIKPRRRNKREEDTCLHFYDEHAILQGVFQGIKSAPKVFGLDENTGSDPGLAIEDTNRNLEPRPSLIPDAKSCSTCQVKFQTQDEQRQHFKLDWHRYNLKCSLISSPTLTEDQFENLILDQLDTLSLSGSESSQDEDENDDSEADKVSTEEDSDHDGLKDPKDVDDEEWDENEVRQRRHPRIFFRDETDRLFSILKCIVFENKEDQSELPEEDVLSRISRVRSHLKWAVFMLGGGHFAGAVFDGAHVVVHKTFHCYTVRAKQGGSQGQADNKSGGSHPKSAGASLRRYNEAALVQHVQDIVGSVWQEELKTCHLIFFRAPSGNRRVLFGGKDPPLDRRDPRLRSIPFATNRATFKEVKRVHEVLSTIQCLGNYEEFAVTLTQDPPKPKVVRENRKKKSKGKNLAIHRSKSREIKERTLPDRILELAEEVSSSEEIGYQDHPEGESALVEFSHTPLKKTRRKKKTPKPSPSVILDVRQDVIIEPVTDSTNQIETRLITACKTGNALMLQEVLDNEHDVTLLLNKPFGASRQTSLHLASCAGKKPVIKKLMEYGADPCMKDKAKKVPYSYCGDKESRNVFIQFMKLNPNKFNYAESGIPPPLSEEAEQRQKEKLKAKRQAKKEKEKAMKEIDKQKKMEEAERQRFLDLSDREKRALAAERRLLQAREEAGENRPVLLRCYLCGKDITGKVPFEYEAYKFCSIKCLKGHREKLRATS
ncbi:hypothetical protein TCAL_00014 [Tigriopus californicus]|uniref:VLRF1 domain-containing protein n=1 Tax=Tigriopus californicus TaxID=6832 RepID=A0A553PFA4_TIGCA|nr:tRNA endonuclease ANKZF1-like [Tigriopus californicus]TRY76362.1 hypothetical protein TCAL_00014 [Tigriopus californicus]|eukprot:TCALIF_00014-PA protein Name:"Similar to ANKZF1 Ankyrin repeat and zinc finger domain-containing protein 1 (Homo sapiens)" AED:0.04 eAED:0.04 QI:0/-1/0/1/-1/1/1/0/750